MTEETKIMTEAKFLSAIAATEKPLPNILMKSVRYSSHTVFKNFYSRKKFL